MIFEYTSFVATSPTDMKLFVYTPLEEENTDEKLRELLRTASTKG
jgi:hypothetical protein